MHGSVRRFRLTAKSPATLITLIKKKQILDVQFFVGAADDKENVQEEEEEEKRKKEVEEEEEEMKKQKKRRRRKKHILHLTIIASCHPVSVTMNIMAGFENYCIWPFSRNAVSDEDIRVVSVVCGGSHEPSVLTVWIHYIIHGTSRHPFGKESGSRRGSFISKRCTQCKQKCWVPEGKIKNSDSDT